MKVCTDSCILGAWTTTHSASAKKMLDIGTGTGLLPLMLAQKSNAKIDAIDWDAESCAQALENCSQSPWSDRIQIFEGDARQYHFPSAYDFIISNPPFFESDLRSPIQKKNLAKHDESLTLDELIWVIRSSLLPTGGFSILLPFHRTGYFEELAVSNGFFLREKLIVRQSPSHPPFRSILLYSCQKPEEFVLNELIIKDEAGKYSSEFKMLMKDYYGGD